MIKTILFDAFGTLISTGTGSVDATAAMLRHLGLSMDPAAFYREWKQLHKILQRAPRIFRTDEQIFEAGLWELFGRYGISADAGEEVHFMLESLLGRKAYPDAEPALSALSRRYLQVLASNTDTAPLLENLRENDLRFHAVYTSESLARYKPDPWFYRMILQELKLLPEETVYVGDSPEEDIWGPAQVGIRTIWLNRKGDACPEGICPDAEIHSLSELPAVLETM